MLSVRCPVCLSVLSVCNVRALWPNGWMDQDETWHAGRLRPRTHCVRWVPSFPAPKWERSPSPIFGPCLYCGQTAAWIKIPRDTEVSLCTDYKKEGRAPNFRPIFCGQTVGCIKIPLGTEVCLGLRGIVLDGDRASLPLKGHSPAIFGQCPL